MIKRFLHNIGVMLVGIILSLALAACCPWPHNEREAPVYEGALTRMGAPAANVRVTLSTQPAVPPGCANSKVETRTDASGKFH